MKKFRVALAGNPNCGKTTIFNILTGSRQHVGNYSGVTVERKSGWFHINDVEIEVIDLPGVYSLSSSSPEEKVAFHELMNTKLDMILNVIDSGNPQRNLYLTTQLAELNIPMLLIFNMVDDASRRGLKFNLPMLEHYFGAQIVRTVGAKGIGIEHVKSAILSNLLSPEPHKPAVLRYGTQLDDAIKELTDSIDKLEDKPDTHIPSRYFAIKLLEGDHTVCNMKVFAPLLEWTEKQRTKLASRLGGEIEMILPDSRYGMISGACREAIRITNEQRRQISDNIDKFITNRYLGLPIFLLIMLLIFTLTFVCAQPFVSLLEWFFGALSAGITAVWPAGQLEYLRSLITDGVIGGVGGVLTFLPNIVFLFLGIAFLEGTGYMARAAYVMDGFMHKFGLHGKSFIPMLLGFGCTVPAVLATRSIESEKDRLTTIMILPLMSCGARLPIYSLFIGAFFPQKYQALLMWIIYIIGVLVALGAARLLKSTLFKGGDEVYVMELPPYRMPTFMSLVLHMWERSFMYLKKAGTVILAASIILFMLNTLPLRSHFTQDYNGQLAQIESKLKTANSKVKADLQEKKDEIEAKKNMEQLEYSFAGRIGKGLSYVLKPIGFDWKVSSALIGAFAAKELFVSQLGILYSVAGPVDENSNDSILTAQLKANYTPLQAFCIMLFCLLSMPCMGTFAVVRKETGSLMLTLLQAGGLTAIAWFMTLIVYQVGSFLIR